MNVRTMTTMVLAGFAAGVAFASACGSNGTGGGLGLGPSPAAAQTACAQYEIQQFDPMEVAERYWAGGVIVPIPPGWTPISEGNGILLARCAQ
ncbi:MAG: hypothetical protein OXU20_17235 [Myxococcales bacterium]|nr:hypothetical protein [Myxococcales bacterium]